MSKRGEPVSKRPSGGRPLPRRLFSFDSLRKEKTGTDNDDYGSESSFSRPASRTRLLERHSTATEGLSTFPETQEENVHVFVSSPDGASDSKDSIGVPVLSKIPARPPPLDLIDSNATLPETVSTTSMPASPSKRRWDTIRHHVLPSNDSISDIPQVPSPPPELSTIPPRPSTPKLYRFGQKKAFRQVVETVQTQHIGEAKKFADALQKACKEARFGDSPRNTKPEREATLATVGSSLYLPFMASTTSLQPTGPQASFNSGPGRAGPLRRPQSMQSLASTNRAPPSITCIARAMASTSSLSRPRELPHEKLVLSTLLLPFLSPHSGSQAESERAIAVETFEYIVRTWRAPAVEAHLDRCIWCCKAASVISTSRMRILGTLSSILFSRDHPFVADTPIVLQTSLHALLSLAYILSLSSGPAELNTLLEYVAAMRQGSTGALSPTALEEEFGIRLSHMGDEATLKEILITEGVARCLRLGPERARFWILRTFLQGCWPVPAQVPNFTPLVACAHWRKLKVFLPAILTLFHTTSFNAGDAGIVHDILMSRILPELGALRDDEANELRPKAVLVALELLSRKTGDYQGSMLTKFRSWYQDQQEWRKSVEQAVQDIITTNDWPSILRLIPTAISEFSLEIQTSLITHIFPLVNKRIFSDPPPYPCAALTAFLDSISRTHPKTFYKPIFACATANKASTVANQLVQLSAISKFIPDLWTRDPEMISVALIGQVDVRAPPEHEGQKWAPVRIGQLAVMAELIERLRAVRLSKDLTLITSTVKFAVALEIRLGSAIEAKERVAALLPAQRLLFCLLFRDVRLLTRSLKPATWLLSAIKWLLSWDSDSRTVSPAAVTLNLLLDVYHEVDSNHNPSSVKDNLRHSRLTMDQAKAEVSKKQSNVVFLAARKEMLSQLCRKDKAVVLELLVSVSGLLSPGDYLEIGPVLWSTYLDENDSTTVAAACFLFMQFAEKTSEECSRLVDTDLSSHNSADRRIALQRIATVAMWRYQLLSQDVILDRNHRRPFKLHRPPVLFVATDIGSSQFVLEDNADEYKDENGHVIPLELRRRLSEIGWAQEDRVIDHRLQRIRTPMSLLPSNLLDRIDLEGGTNVESQSPIPSPEPSPTRSAGAGNTLQRQDSGAGGRHGGKRRPVFVSSMVSLFPKLAAMANDSDFAIACAARTFIVDYMRDDPTLLARPMFQLITGDTKDVITAISALRSLLHVRHILPPSAAHHLLNHLTGFLKSSGRQNEVSDPLRAYAYSISIIAKLIPQVSKVSIRELRRAKIDAFLIPSGSLWFPETAPPGPMFPRSLPDHGSTERLPSSIVNISLIRISQNMLFLSMLKRNPGDIKVIRKHMVGFQLPSMRPDDDTPILTLQNMIPRRKAATSASLSDTYQSMTALSLTLARSYLLLIQQIFQCMSRHMSDREELATLMEGLNRVLLAHGDDIGIVSHVMLSYMTASTRFKRLFVSSGGYTLFMPALFKTFVEAESNQDVRQAILYAVGRFYSLHQDSFIFQSVDVVAQIVNLPAADAPWIARSAYVLFASLRHGFISGTPDAAGIHNLNKAQEQEALIVTMAEEVPQTFLANLRRSGGSLEKAAFSLPNSIEVDDSKRFKLDDLVRLFLTVIAHNPGIHRAELFLRLLRLLTPQLFSASRTVQNILRSGVDALGGILLAKSPGKAKGQDLGSTGSTGRPSDELAFEGFAEKKPTGSGSASANLLDMRLEYLSLIVAFARAGGHISAITTLRIVELLKSILKESRTSTTKASAFLADLVHAVVLREDNPPDVKDVNALLEAIAPIVSAHASAMDLSGLYEVLVSLSDKAIYTSDSLFARILVTQYCRIGLIACEKIVADDLLLAFSLRGPLVKLLTRAVGMEGADVVSELERRAHTHNFLAGIILPLSLALRTSSDFVADNQWAVESWRRDAFSRVWLRLLNLVLAVCDHERPLGIHRRTSSLTQPEIHKSREHRSMSLAPLRTLAMALQVLKIVVTRAEEDISDAAPGIWVRIGNILKSLLGEGDAMFAFKFRDYSEPPSPALSPRTSAFPDQPPAMLAFPSSTSFDNRRSSPSPSMIDFLAWSIIEWVWLRRSPLTIQMRIFAQERITNLAKELHEQGSVTLSRALPARSRRVSSVFSKPRRSMLGSIAASSTTTTPRSSALIGASVSLPIISDFSPNSSTPLTPSRSMGTRQPGYARLASPVLASSRSSQDSIPKIVHLGPINTSSAQSIGARPVSPSGNMEFGALSGKALAKETRVSSPALVKMTYKRIRVMQNLMGYSNLLPMSQSDYLDKGNTDAEAKLLTKNAILQSIVDETKALLEEFRDGYDELGDESMVMVDSQTTLIEE